MQSHGIERLMKWNILFQNILEQIGYHILQHDSYSVFDEKQSNQSKTKSRPNKCAHSETKTNISFNMYVYLNVTPM